LSVGDCGAELPDDAEAAASCIDSRLAWRLFDPASNGLGLRRDLDPVWQGLSRIQHAEVLVISQHPEMYAKESAVDSTGRCIQKVATSLSPNTPHNRTLHWGISPIIGAFILASHTPA
jgi:hypothetical protein